MSLGVSQGEKTGEVQSFFFQNQLECLVYCIIRIANQSFLTLDTASQYTIQFQLKTNLQMVLYLAVIKRALQVSWITSEISSGESAEVVFY